MPRLTLLAAHEVQIPHARGWYAALADAGVAVHYCSNAPMELHLVVRGYLHDAGLP